MFNFFNKKEKPEEEEKEGVADDIAACITYYVKSDGTPMVDIHMSDYEEETIKGMQELLMGLMDADFFPDTLEMLKEGLVNGDNPELFVSIATKIALERVQKRLLESQLLEDSLTKGEEEPCIKPSDIL